MMSYRRICTPRSSASKRALSSGITLKPTITASEASASVTSATVTPPTEACSTLIFTSGCSNLLQASVGGVTVADVTLADASDAVIVGYGYTTHRSLQHLDLHLGMFKVLQASVGGVT